MGKKSRKKNEKKAGGNVEASQRVGCKICKKTFSKVANLNAHIAVKHKGRRFICNVCEEEQTTKASYIRHMERKHPNEETANVKERESYITEKIVMTEAAKDALLERLNKESQKGYCCEAKKNHQRTDRTVRSAETKTAIGYLIMNSGRFLSKFSIVLFQVNIKIVSIKCILK